MLIQNDTNAVDINDLLHYFSSTHLYYLLFRYIRIVLCDSVVVLYVHLYQDGCDFMPLAEAFHKTRLCSFCSISILHIGVWILVINVAVNP